MAQPAEAAEYTVSISAQRLDSPSQCPRYDTKLSDGEASAMLDIWGTRSALSLPFPTGTLLNGVVALDRVLSMIQIEQLFLRFNCV